MSRATKALMRRRYLCHHRRIRKAAQSETEGKETYSGQSDKNNGYPLKRLVDDPTRNQQTAHHAKDDWVAYPCPALEG